MNKVEFGDPRLPDRFWDKIGIGDTDCWLWIAAKQQGGYGQFRWKGQTLGAYRVAYEALVAPIPGGLKCDHLCRVRACVNPAHIEIVTRQENTTRGIAGDANRMKSHCPHGHPYSGENLYICPKGGRNCRTCKREDTRKRRAKKKANR